MYNIDVAREIYKRLLENGINMNLAGIPIVEEVLNEETERRRLGDSSALEVDSTPEALSAGQGESTPAPNH
jgi:hypothetical protein